jgi:hypothetical protein
VDKYASVRTISFDNLAPALGIDLNRFKRKKEEWQGYCPVHNSKSNNNCFSYHDSGKFHCFSCSAKGAGAIDLAKLVKEIGFQAAVELLSAVQVPPAPQKPALAHSESVGGELKPLEKDTWRKYAIPCDWLKERIPDPAVLESVRCVLLQQPGA